MTKNDKRKLVDLLSRIILTHEIIQNLARKPYPALDKLNTEIDQFIDRLEETRKHNGEKNDDFRKA